MTVTTIQLVSPDFDEVAASPRDTELAAEQRLLVPLPYGDVGLPGGDEPAVVPR